MSPATVELPASTRSITRAKPTREYQKHGLTALKKAVKELGTGALDGRTSIAKELAEECRELVNALGGEGEVSPQERALVEMIAQKRVRRKIASQWALLNRNRLFNKKKMKFAPIALELEQLEESEARLLDKLGLKRRARPTPSLQDYLAAKENKEPPMSSPDEASERITESTNTQHKKERDGDAP